MILRSVDVDRGHIDDPGRWPWTVPAIGHVVEHGLKFTTPFTVLVGGNGTGKSTLIEAIAEKYGIDAAGGHGGRRYAAADDKSVLGKALRLHRADEGRRYRGSSAKGFFLRAETAFGLLSWMTGNHVPGYGDLHSEQISHGESYIQLLAGRFNTPGLYLLDEAEGPLSFQSTLSLVFKLADLTSSGNSQVIYATHSPLVAGVPGATVLELSEDGITPCRWSDLEMVRLWRTFLEEPRRFFR